MSRKFASGKKAKGICDRCGDTWKLHLLREEYVRGIGSNNQVCPDCFDGDHPQNWVGRVPIADAEALREPRPDRDPGRNGTVIAPLPKVPFP